MRAPAAYLFAATFVAALLLGAEAQAQQEPMNDPYFAVKLLLGLGGEVEAEGGEDDLLLSFGAGFQYMHPLHDNFALGAGLGMQSWQSEGLDDVDADRNLLFDLTLLPQGKLPLNDSVELYVMLPVGLSLDALGDDSLGASAAGVSAGVEVDTAIGFTIGVLLGARFALSDSLGLLAELGYVTHSYEHEVTINAGPIAGSANFDLDLAQFALNFGVYF